MLTSILLITYIFSYVCIAGVVLEHAHNYI
jgi:hypothetical protein